MAASVAAAPATLRAGEFQWIARFLRSRTGIVLREGKEAMVMGRLDRRLRHHGLDNYGEYFRLLDDPAHAAEATIAVDLLTTNETYFFREPPHFDFLRGTILPGASVGRPFRVWSAASSTGEEAYSIAMTLAEHRRAGQWEVIGTDISTRVLDRARRALYPIDGARHIPRDLLQKHMLKGRDEYDGYMLVDPALRRHVSFRQANLLALPGDLGRFDVIFLRNVLIYFEGDTKTGVVRSLLNHLQPDGHLFVSHSESLNGMGLPVKAVRPAIYRLA